MLLSSFIARCLGRLTLPAKPLDWLQAFKLNLTMSMMLARLIFGKHSVTASICQNVQRNAVWDNSVTAQESFQHRLPRNVVIPWTARLAH
eukprot:scaffold658286_cov64-Prasinocladus_malaysianus.AAC.1